MKTVYEVDRMTGGVRTACNKFARDFSFMLDVMSYAMHSAHDVPQIKTEGFNWVFTDEVGSEPIECVTEVEVSFVRLGMMNCNDTARFPRVLRGACFAITGVHMADNRYVNWMPNAKREWMKDTRRSLLGYRRDRNGRMMMRNGEYLRDPSLRIRHGYLGCALDNFWTAVFAWNSLREVKP